MSLRQSGGSERGAGAEGESSCEGRRKESHGEDRDGARSATAGAGRERWHETGSSSERPSPQPMYPSGSPPTGGEPQDLGMAAGVGVRGLGWGGETGIVGVWGA